ncbi:MAG: sulfotransferase [Nitrospirae bacterium]|nr:MAG: sulfotransferase [Nitrospirota bacterium]
MQPRKDQIDFIIIGAQKAGTTTLFRLLNEHPQIHMPLEKEAPFFTQNHACESNALRNYLAETFGNAPENKLWGKATPSYLCDPSAARKIRKVLPHIKLIVILRDPIDRTFSHYLMSTRRRIESRNFSEVVQCLIEDPALSQTRILPYSWEAENSCYLAWSEYGRLLKPYSDFISHGQLLILFMDELAHNPLSLLDKIMTFLGLETGFMPKNIGRRYHVGGSQLRFPSVYKWFTHESKKLLPPKWQRLVRFWAELWLTIPLAQEHRSIDENTYKRLRDHFQKDIALLEQITGLNVPWTHYKS